MLFSLSLLSSLQSKYFLIYTTLNMNSETILSRVSGQEVLIGNQVCWSLLSLLSPAVARLQLSPMKIPQLPCSRPYRLTTVGSDAPRGITNIHRLLSIFTLCCHHTISNRYSVSSGRGTGINSKHKGWLFTYY
jgi:hypothetical protein